MRLALAQIDTVVGDIPGNLASIRAAVARARDARADLLVLPELAVVGYPAGDLLGHRAFVEMAQAAVHQLVSELDDELAVLVGSAAWPRDGALPFNVAHFISRHTLATVHKRLLPSYDVFHETRLFARGDVSERAVFELAGIRIGVTICEDLWNDTSFWPGGRQYRDDPVLDVVHAGAQLVVNLSASPYEAGKVALRANVIQHAAQRHRVGVALCNLVGGNDSMVFDGSSMLADVATGTPRLAGLARAFAEDFLLADFEPARGFVRVDEQAAQRATTLDLALTHNACQVPCAPDTLDELERALVVGIRAFVRKQGFERVLLGLSGGIDSALVAYLAAQALGPENVLAVELPSRFTSELSRSIAANLVGTLGVHQCAIDIESTVQVFLGNLAPELAHCASDSTSDVTAENLQARVRGTILMTLSNRLGNLVLATGNKSELAVGYCTLYGDMVGALAPIGDLYKTQVCAMCRRVNARERREIFPRAVLERPPTAELRHRQRDEDTLPAYATMDPILVGILEDRLDDGHIAALTGTDPPLVRHIRELVRRGEFKRFQAPPSLRVSVRSWPGRAYPIVQRYRPDDSLG